MGKMDMNVEVFVRTPSGHLHVYVQMGHTWESYKPAGSLILAKMEILIWRTFRESEHCKTTLIEQCTGLGFTPDKSV
jgi:hypothetical protein